MHCLSFAQHVGDSIPWCADTTYEYYEKPTGEKIPKDLQPVEEEREWCADDVEYVASSYAALKRDLWDFH